MGAIIGRLTFDREEVFARSAEPLEYAVLVKAA
jgi:hypothetical protein